MCIRDSYKDRDTLVWEVNYRFLEPMLADSLRAVAMGMQVIYEKDTVSYTHLDVYKRQYLLRVILLFRQTENERKRLRIQK